MMKVSINSARSKLKRLPLPLSGSSIWGKSLTPGRIGSGCGPGSAKDGVDIGKSVAGSSGSGVSMGFGVSVGSGIAVGSSMGVGGGSSGGD